MYRKEYIEKYSIRSRVDSLANDIDGKLPEDIGDL